MAEKIRSMKMEMMKSRIQHLEQQQANNTMSTTILAQLQHSQQLQQQHTVYPVYQPDHGNAYLGHPTTIL